MVILKMFSIALLNLSLQVQNPDPVRVQIFDVQEGRVVKQIPLAPELEKSIIHSLQDSPKMYGGFSVNPKNGVILHVQFANPIQISSPLFPDSIKELYLILEKDTQPMALIFFNSTSKYIVVVLNGTSESFRLKNHL